MASATSQTELKSWWPIVILMAVMVTADIALRVAKHWSAYGGFDRVEAVFVLLMLLAYPWAAVRKHMTVGSQLCLAYTLVMLVAAILH